MKISANIILATIGFTTLSLVGCAQTKNLAPAHAASGIYKVDDSHLGKVTANDPKLEIFYENEHTFDEQFAPYYAQLNDQEKIIYKQLFRAIVKLEDEITPSNIALADQNFHKIQLALSHDQPELFWFENITLVRHMIQYEGESFKRLQSVSYQINYNDLASDLTRHQKEIVSELDNILAQASKFRKLPQQELSVHDYFIDNVRYKSGSKYNQNAYSTFVRHETVCTGFAKAFQIVMRKLGIPAYYVPGHKLDVQRNQRTVSDSDLHAWNVIMLDGKAYNVDVTNDLVQMTGADGDKYPMSIYKYFNRTDKVYASNGYTTDFLKKDSFEGLKLNVRATSMDLNADVVVTARHIIERLSRIYPMDMDSIVNNSADFAATSKKQLAHIDGKKATVYTLIMSSGTYNTVSKYSWKEMEKAYLTDIYKANNIDGKNIQRETIDIMDNVKLFINRYTFRNK